MDGATEKRGGWLARLLLVLTGGLLAGGLLACRSLSKPRMERRLADLTKNEPAAALRRVPMRFEHAGGSWDLELVHLHEPARRPADEAYPVVLVHGTPATLFSWVEPIYGGPGFEGLAADRDVYAIEVVGHGVAPGGPARLSFAACARFVEGAIRTLGLEGVHLVGFSYGGEFAWRAALDAPELVRSLALLDSSGLPRRPEDWLPEEVAMRENPLAGFGWLLNARDRIRGALEPHFRSVPPDRTEEVFLVCQNAANWRGMVDLARDENGERANQLGGIEAPTLLLWGADDIAYPPTVYARGFAAQIPDARLRVLPETGHYPHEERPAEVVRLLRAFFAEVEAEGSR